MLYFLSDLLSCFLKNIIKYRSETIDKNLKDSFPEKSEKELKTIKRKFYRNFSDILLETLKSYSSSPEMISKRIKTENLDILDKHYDEGKSCVILMAHYGNWEWVSNPATKSRHVICVLYKTIKNPWIDRLMYKGRKKSGILLYPLEKTGNMIRENLKKPAAFGYITDQSPTGDVADEFWIDFLNRKTAVISGAEALARRFDLPVYYNYVRRVKRGYYVTRLIPVHLQPQQTKAGFISSEYMKILEKHIQEKPEDWLWSHRRWKRKALLDLPSNNNNQ
jgi:KDO2-lipid IV(A) lauroyltransferase